MYMSHMLAINIAELHNDNTCAYWTTEKYSQEIRKIANLKAN